MKKTMLLAAVALWSFYAPGAAAVVSDTVAFRHKSLSEVVVTANRDNMKKLTPHSRLWSYPMIISVMSMCRT